MSRAKLISVSAIFVLVAAACAEGASDRKRSNDDDDGGGGSTTATGTGGADPSIEGSCSAVCANAASAGCPGFDQSLCLEECGAFDAQTPPACTGAADAVLGCWAVATPLCGPEAIVFEGCGAAEEGYASCVSETGSTTSSTTTSASSSTSTGGGGCAHSECLEGGLLSPSCSPCAASICSVDPYCCDTAWDSACVSQALENPSCGC